VHAVRGLEAAYYAGRVISITGELLGFQVVFANAERIEQFPHPRDHSRRTGEVVDGLVQVRDIPRQHFFVHTAQLITPAGMPGFSDRGDERELWVLLRPSFEVLQKRGGHRVTVGVEQGERVGETLVNGTREWAAVA